jgi:type I restriction enzyme R subunit
MTHLAFTEEEVEEAAISWFSELGYAHLYGPDILPGEPQEERRSLDQVILTGRLKRSLERINPQLPQEALEEALRKATRTHSLRLEENNRLFHKFLAEGVDVEYRRPDNGEIAHGKAWLVDFDDLERNDWLVVNQFTVIESGNHRRPDLVVFVNGLPLAVIELKNPADQEATVDRAFHQLQTYKKEIPSLFHHNETLGISDYMVARAGTLTANRERFMPWRTIDGQELAPLSLPQLEVLIKGVFDKNRFLDLIRYFVVFEENGPHIVKKMAGYHQFHAANKAVE